MVLDLAQFDTLATDLDLSVLATKEQKQAVWHVLDQVTGLVQTRTPVEREPVGLGNKRRFGLLLVAQVMASQRIALDEKLTNGADRGEFVVVVAIDYPAVATNCCTDVVGHSTGEDVAVRRRVNTAL